MDSDVPVPSGRTLPLTTAEKKRGRKEKVKEKTKLAAIMVSNCGGKNKRWKYVEELRKHMPVDVYGACGNLRCVRLSAMFILACINEDKTAKCPLIKWDLFLEQKMVLCHGSNIHTSLTATLSSVWSINSYKNLHNPTENSLFASVKFQHQLDLRETVHLKLIET
jgi:hypothetical protein